VKALPWTLRELARWARWGCLEERIEELLRPQDMVWPEQEDDFELSCRLISAALPGAQRHLLPQALTAAILSGKAAAPGWLRQKVLEQIDRHEPGIALPPALLCQASWDFAPMILAGEGHAQISWGLVGLFKTAGQAPCWPAWWERTADREALEAVALALNLAHRRTGGEYFFWPLLGFHDRLLVSGESIALPIFLAAWALSRGISNRLVAATGRLSISGEILPVARLEQKAALAEEYGLKTLLHPCGSKPDRADSTNLELIEVADLDEACLVLEAYGPGKNQQLLYNYRALVDAEHLSCSLHLLTPAVLRSRRCSTRYAEQALSVCANPALLARAVQNLEQIMHDPDSRVDLLALLLEPFSAETLRRCATQSPAAAFTLAQLRLALANRQGRIEQSRQWCELGNELAANVAAHPEGIERQADFINRWLIHEHHNRYDFCPDLPPSILTILHSLEHLAEVAREHFGERATPVLGRLYGTLAQHYGFCGPDYLHETLRYVELSQRAFGDGRLPEYRVDWRRPSIYRFYALLDAGLTDEARLALIDAIGFDPNKLQAADFAQLNAYQHAALARFYGETRQAPPEYADWCRRKLWDLPRQHPWQLWSKNVASFPRDKELQKAALEMALKICTQPGATVRAMALMPLEQLWRRRLADDHRLAARTAETLDHLRSSALHQAHFAALFQSDNWRDVLQTVSQARNRLFPFSYR
jgi:hypothetical protein